MTTAPTTPGPNHYNLCGKDLTVDYSTTSIAGVPILTVEHKRTKKAFRGDQIRTADTPLGRLVTVTLESVADLHEITLSVAIPRVNLDGDESPIRSFAVITTSRTSIAGPRLVRGQIELYETEELQGKADQVVS